VPDRHSGTRTAAVNDNLNVRLINGRQSSKEEFCVSVYDDGFRRGDGVFEVVRLYGGRTWALDPHLKRLRHSAASLELPYDEQALRAECQLVVKKLAHRDAFIRVIVTRGGMRFITTEPNVNLPDRIGLYTIEHLVTPLLSGVKSLSYAANFIAKRIAVRAGEDDALLISASSRRVLEGCTSTFFWESGGRLYTPPLSEGILDSITRQALLQCADCEERPCQLTDLVSADGAAMAGTGIELRPVARIRGAVRVDFPKDSPGLIAAATTLRSWIATHLDPEPRLSDTAA
jgi:branched-chain amino acid aminotransferase